MGLFVGLEVFLHLLFPLILKQSLVGEVDGEREGAEDHVSSNEGAVEGVKVSSGAGEGENVTLGESVETSSYSAKTTLQSERRRKSFMFIYLFDSLLSLSIPLTLLIIV